MGADMTKLNEEELARLREISSTTGLVKMNNSYIQTHSSLFDEDGEYEGVDMTAQEALKAMESRMADIRELTKHC